MRKILSLILISSFGIQCNTSNSQQEANNSIRNVSTINKDTTLQFEWAVNFGESSNVMGSTMKNDRDGNLYIIGTFYNTVDFDPGPGEYKMTVTGEEDNSAYILKLDSSGKFIWAQQINNAGVISLTVGNSGNIYIIGDIVGDVDLNPNKEEFNVSTHGYRFMYILKLNPFGDFIWAKSIGGKGEIAPKSICIDGNENFYVKGYFNGKIDFSAGKRKIIIGSICEAPSIDYEVFISKFNLNGDAIWVKNHRTNSTTYWFENSIAIDKRNNVYYCGVYDETIGFNSNKHNDDVYSSNYGTIYVAKLDNNGNTIWRKPLGNKYCHSQSISVDTKNNVLLTGLLKYSADFDPDDSEFILNSKGKHDAFVLKLDSNGHFLWAKSYGGKNDDFTRCILTDKNNNIYIIGTFSDSIYDSSNNLLLETQFEISDIFISKINEDGKMIWIEKIGNKNIEDGNYISIDEKNNVFFACSIEGKLKLNIDSSIKEINTFEESALILKLSVNKN